MSHLDKLEILGAQIASGGYSISAIDIAKAIEAYPEVEVAMIDRASEDIKNASAITGIPVSELLVKQNLERIERELKGARNRVALRRFLSCLWQVALVGSGVIALIDIISILVDRGAK